ncbi:MAG: TIGR03936 family radical SAM-associated protein [Clostridia bacterium]|nr:TIGR03936 family radical SAM-associated protein [Clostridia bacterium]
MILFRYTKIDGAEYISHLDVLRHIGRTFTRAGIKVGYSQGYHPHMLVYLSAPIGVGMKSLSEYCLIETEEPLENFVDRFNEKSPRGLKCTGAWFTPKKVGVASDIVKAQYFISGLSDFDVNEIAAMPEFIIDLKDGKTRDVKSLIYSVERAEGGIRCVLGFSNGLRAERFAAKLKEMYGGENIDIVKEKALLSDGREFEYILG